MNFFLIISAVIFIVIIVVIVLGMTFTSSETKVCSEGNCYPADMCIRPSKVTNINSYIDTRFTARVEWSPSKYAEGYNIYRSATNNVSPSNYEEKISVEGKNNTSITFTNLTVTPQYFAVTAHNVCGESVVSDTKEAEVKCYADTPENLTASFWMAGLAIASWSPVPSAITYKLYVNSIPVYNNSGTSFVFVTDHPGTYIVQVSSVNACGESPKSPIATVTI